MFVLLLALLVGFHVASLELSSEFLSPTCPFVDSRDRENEWNFGSLLETVKAQAEQKLTERERCLANYNQLVNNLSTIKNLYAFENNPVLRQQIERDVFVRELTDLKLELVDLELKGQQNSFQYDSLFSESLVLKDALRRNEMDLKYSGPEFDKNKENFFKSEALQHVNNIVSTLSTLDASCVEHIGGWGQVIPSLLSVAGMAVGATGFGQSALLGSALTIASNISILFQNHDIKKAINEVDKQKNMKVMA